MQLNLIYNYRYKIVQIMMYGSAWHWSAAVSKLTREGHYHYILCQGKGKFGNLEGGGSHVVLMFFMVPLCLPGARTMQELWLPFEYYNYHNK